MIPECPKGQEHEAQIEIKRLEENEEFLERAVHLALGCCDASDVPCEERDAESLYAHVRSGTTPTTQRALSGLLREMAAKTSAFRRALAFADAHVPQWERIIADHKAEVERLTAEVERLRRRIGSIRGSLVEVVWESLPPNVSTEGAVQWLVSEHERMREQLATAVVLPTGAKASLMFAIAAVVEEDMDDVGIDYLADKVLDLVRSWGVSSSEVEAPQPQELTQHTVRIEPYRETMWDAYCVTLGCGQHRSGSLKQAQDWKDQHEADTLRPVLTDGSAKLTDESFISQHDEGRPSGSGAATPHSGVGPLEPPAYVVALAQPAGSYWKYLIRGTKRGWYFSNSLTPEATVAEGSGWGWAYSRAEFPLRPVTQVRDIHGDVWTHVPGTFEWSSPETQNCAWSYMARKWAPLTEVAPTEPQDAAQAARSEATPQDPPAVVATETEPSGAVMTECPDGAQCHRECVAPACIRVATCGPMSRVFPSDRWPHEVVAKHGPGSLTEVPSPSLRKEGEDCG